ncbi:MAG: shikimate dehydrogenase, partial [Anaerolineae bacterium]|nr:shikimate dehydrogenase [Anaerolineae bacterium]
GATGTIGSACAQMLAAEVGELVLVGRRPEALAVVAEQCSGQRARVSTHTDLHAIYRADVVITVTNAVHAIIEPQHLKPGAVVCDVARPRDVSRQVEAQRSDVLVIEGGMVEVPGPVDFGFDFGFPPGKSFACMAETMILALEGRYEDYTVGKTIALDRVLEIGALDGKAWLPAERFRSFERAVTEEHIAQVRELAHDHLKHWSPSLADGAG